MKKILIIACAVLIFSPLSFAGAKEFRQTRAAQSLNQQSNKAIHLTNASNNSQGNGNSRSNGTQNQDQTQTRDRERDGDCDGDGIINSQDTAMDESINACKQYQNRNKWASGYNPRSETARQHMSIVAQAIEQLLRFGSDLSDQTIGEQIRLIARQHGQTAQSIIENEDKLNQRSGVLKFFVGPDYAAIDTINQQMEQLRHQVRELNQIRTQMQNENDQTELQNQIQILELQLSAFQNSLQSQESVFSLFGWLAKLLN